MEFRATFFSGLALFYPTVLKQSASGQVFLIHELFLVVLLLLTDRLFKKIVTKAASGSQNIRA